MTSNVHPIDPQLKLLVETSMMSPDQRVQHYLEILLMRKENRLRFQIVGNIAIEQSLITLPNGIVLEPQAINRKPNKRISQMSAEEIKKLHDTEYVIDGYKDVELQKKEEATKFIVSIVEEIETTVNLLGFCVGARLYWYPAHSVSDNKGNRVIVPVPLEAKWYVRPEEKHIKFFIDSMNQMQSVHTRERSDICRAIDWYQQGINSRSVLNSFLAFWNAVETLAQALSQKRLNKKFSRNDLEKAFKIVFGRAAARPLVEQFYGKRGNAEVKDFQTTGYSQVPLVDIRNDITHGNISEADIQQKYRVKGHINEIENLARRFLLGVLEFKPS